MRSLLSLRKIFLSLFLLALSSLPADAQSVVLEDLGLSAVSTRSAAVDVNDSGEITGWASYPTDQYTFYRDADGLLVHEIKLVGQSRPLGINNLGEVVGWSRVDDGAIHGFVWKDWGIRELLTFGGRYSQPRDFNDLGQVVGDAYACTNDCPFAAIWEAGSESPSFLGGNIYSFGHFINNFGDVAGTDWICASGQGCRHTPVVWTRTPDGYEMTYLMPGIAGGVNGINDLGQVIGIYHDPAARRSVTFLWQDGALTELEVDGNLLRGPRINNSGQVIGDTGTEAWLWENGQWTELGGLRSQYPNTRPVAINDFGQIVGWSYTEESNRHAFVWENGQMTDLGTLEGGSYSHAFNLNNFGAIVGVSQTASGEEHAVLWRVPPSPRSSVPEVDAMIDTLGSLVEEGRLEERIGDALVIQLEIVKNLLTDYHETAACRLLGAFTTRVEALMGAGQIWPEDGRTLIEGAGDVGACN